MAVTTGAMANLSEQVDMPKPTATYEGTPCRKCGRTTRYAATGKCVPCRTEVVRQWRKAKRAADPEWVRRQQLRNRDWWTQNGSTWNTRRRGSRQEADAVYYRERYATDEEFKERAHARERKRRALLNSVPSEPYTRDQAYAQTGGRCTRCRRVVRKDSSWHVDHRVPLARGGADLLTNVGPCHPKCNLRGGATIAKTQESLFAI